MNDIFEYQALLNILQYLIIPILLLYLLYKIKPKMLWLAPFLTVVFDVAITIIAIPSILEYIYIDNGQIKTDGHLGLWLLAVVLQFIVAVLFTAIFYLALFISKKVKSKNAKKAEIDKMNIQDLE